MTKPQRTYKTPNADRNRLADDIIVSPAYRGLKATITRQILPDIPPNSYERDEAVRELVLDARRTTNKRSACIAKLRKFNITQLLSELSRERASSQLTPPSKDRNIRYDILAGMSDHDPTE